MQQNNNFKSANGMRKLFLYSQVTIHPYEGWPIKESLAIEIQ